MNLLKNHLCYLSGPMDRVNERFAMSWRADLTNSLHFRDIGVLNPCNKPIISDYKENSDFKENIKQLKSEGKLEEVADKMKQICRDDLRMVDKADFLIALIDLDVHMCGTYHEVFEAISKRTPCLTMFRQGKHNAPNWLYGVIPQEFMFSDFFHLLEYVDNISSGKIKNPKWWRFFDFNKVFKCNHQ